MPNNYKRSKRSRVAAGVLCGVMAVAALAGAGTSLYMGIKNNGWFSSDETETETEETMDNVVVTETLSNNMKLSCSPVLLASTNSTAESTYTLTATVTPGYATDSSLTWSIAWDTTWSGYTTVADDYCSDVYGDEWADGLISADDLADYVTLSATSGNSIVLSCYQPFGNPIIVTCAANDGSGCNATCQIDYQSYFTGVTITDLSNVTMSSSGSSVQSVYIGSYYTTGTIKAAGSLTYNCDVGKTIADGFTCYTDDYLYSYALGDFDGYDAYTSEDAWEYDINSLYKGSTSSVSNSFYTKIFEFSKNWTTFVTSLIDGSTYILGNDSGWSYSDYGSKALADFYNAVSYCGVANFHPFSFSVSLTDTKTGKTYSASTDLTFSSLSSFPTFSVTGIGLNTTNVTF